MKSTVSVILFSRHQEELLGPALERAGDYLRHGNASWEVITADPAVSTHPEFGRSLITRIRESKHEIIALWDVQTASPIKEIERFLPFLHEGYDLVVGSRYWRGESIVQKTDHNFLYWREKVINFMTRLRWGLALRDFRSGCLVFRKEWFERILEKKKLEALPDIPLFLRQSLQDGWRVREVGIMWISRGDAEDIR